MTNKNHVLTFAYLTAFSVIVLALAFFAISLSAHPAKADNAYTSSQFSVASSSTKTVSVTTSGLVLATTSPTHTRLFADICDTSATVPIVIAFTEGGVANATTNGGIWVNSNTCFEITTLKLYTGAVTASTSNGSAVGVTVTEFEN